jgi:hypothetical protein
MLRVLKKTARGRLRQRKKYQHKSISPTTSIAINMKKIKCNSTGISL